MKFKDYLELAVRAHRISDESQAFIADQGHMLLSTEGQLRSYIDRGWVVVDRTLVVEPNSAQERANGMLNFRYWNYLLSRALP